VIVIYSNLKNLSRVRRSTKSTYSKWGCFTKNNKTATILHPFIFTTRSNAM